jgi:hypothetical protein
LIVENSSTLNLFSKLINLRDSGNWLITVT